MSGKKDNDPRPWCCTRSEAIYCPHHGDCSCPQNADRVVERRSLRCPLHGVGSTHPNLSKLVE